jgi:hypothetical protein
MRQRLFFSLVPTGLGKRGVIHCTILFWNTEFHGVGHGVTRRAWETHRYSFCAYFHTVWGLEVRRLGAACSGKRKRISKQHPPFTSAPLSDRLMTPLSDRLLLRWLSGAEAKGLTKTPFPYFPRLNQGRRQPTCLNPNSRRPSLLL